MTNERGVRPKSGPEELRRLLDARRNSIGFAIQVAIEGTLAEVESLQADRNQLGEMVIGYLGWQCLSDVTKRHLGIDGWATELSDRAQAILDFLRDDEVARIGGREALDV